jgi:quaternary ammonium compound-resistance protein SugE
MQYMQTGWNRIVTGTRQEITRVSKPSSQVCAKQNNLTGRTIMAWAYLTVAGLFEIGWAIGLKYSDGFSKLVPSLLTVWAMAASLWLLSIAMRTIPVGTAYAVWTGIGAVGVAILGMVLFAESRDILRLLCLFLIIAGIFGLKLVS